MYDVVVVGAGPGGSTAARYLAKLGLSVALIDKDQFPRDKACGGGFAFGIINDFPYLRKKAQSFLSGVCEIGVLHSPNRRIVLKGKVNMATALRYDFDKALFDAAVEEGAEPVLSTRIKSICVKDDIVSLGTSKDGIIQGKAVIGADGVGSIVARSLNLHRRWPSNRITACRVAEVPENSEFISQTFGKEYHFFANVGGLPGYGWIFPKKNTINIGLGIVGSHAQGLPRYFNRFVQMLKTKNLLRENADLSSAKGALVPTGGTIAKTFGTRALLVGDSAGMVSPLTGGGIHYAMKAGRIAAYVLAQGIDTDRLDVQHLSIYQKLWMNDFGREINPMLMAQRIFTGPFTNLLFEIAQRDESLQSVVSEAMAESSQGIDVKGLLLKTLKVIGRSAFHL
ncbi:MAG: NAD(P)/FAD-dependent oxidoreductase [Candidatus Thorarchaeota archaeon]